MTDYILLYTPCATLEEARTIGKTLVLEHLVACANILPHMESFYYWADPDKKMENEALYHEPEALLLMKTRQSLFAAAKQRIEEMHSYTLPCIVALPIANGNAGYLEWLGEHTFHTNMPIE